MRRRTKTSWGPRAPFDSRAEGIFGRYQIPFGPFSVVLLESRVSPMQVFQVARCFLDAPVRRVFRPERLDHLLDFRDGLAQTESPRLTGKRGSAKLFLSSLQEGKS